MLKNKKAQGLSLNTIIIAAIVLIVLVVLIMVFTGRMGWFHIGLFNATRPVQCDGQVIDTLPCPDEYPRLVIGNFDNVGPGQHCCMAETT